ncbi:MAG: mannonate dehydratase [Acidobacteria bacterium]|jgi:mannonate dehydratase|nr:mannonate dehydratase [Acidobacteriota bacterium]
MKPGLSRRGFLQASSAFALIPAPVESGPGAAPGRDWPPAGGPGVPKLCLGTGSSADAKQMRKLKQIGIDHVLMGGPPMPWKEEDLRALMERFQANGLTVCNLMIYGYRNTLYGRPGRDEEIDKFIQSIRAAGKVGMPVIEYNFYAHRLMKGYHEVEGRGGAGLTAYDYSLSRDLPPLPEVGTHTLDEMWANITYFLKAVVPVAEEAGVRLALHPNDPPVPLSRGSEQIMATLAGWKKLIEIVPSPANGITYDCGVTREMGEDAVEVCRYFGERDRINHVHFRNVRVKTPYVDYVEVFPDEGQVDMFAVMKELVRQKYPRAIYPEHPRALDADRELEGFRPYYPGGGGYSGLVYNVAYTKAMLQAALSN